MNLSKVDPTKMLQALGNKNWLQNMRALGEMRVSQDLKLNTIDSHIHEIEKQVPWMMILKKDRE